MNAEFVDTNILLYAHDRGAGAKHHRAVGLLTRLWDEGSGALSTQILCEFYAAATRKLGMESREAEAVIDDLSAWMIHRPAHDDILRAIALQRRHRLSWWDALAVQSAIELGATTLWTEDLNDGRRFGHLTARNPLR
jgi:predicted nucleic acid-binding protein